MASDMYNASDESLSARKRLYTAGRIRHGVNGFCMEFVSRIRHGINGKGVKYIVGKVLLLLLRRRKAIFTQDEYFYCIL